MSYRAMMLNKLAKLVDHHLGYLIEEIAEKYYKNEIDLEIEYDDLLKYITRRLLNDPIDYNEEELRRTLKEITSEVGVCRLIISYLVSEYIREYGEDEVHSIDLEDLDDDDEFDEDIGLNL